MMRKKIGFFGHFGMINLGNESTLQAILYHLRRFLPNAEFNCICSHPEETAKAYSIKTARTTVMIVKPWKHRGPMARLVRMVLVGIPNELYRWLESFKTLWGMDVLIVPGTGLLTDAFGFFGWGPYDMFRWSLTAKLCRCKLLFVSVGVGPIYSTFGKWVVKAALFMADFRSYRDSSTVQYLKSIGFSTNGDRVYPDLVFSLPEAIIPSSSHKAKNRPIVGLGLMVYAGKYSVAEPNNATYQAYLENLALFVNWLLDHDYDVRLLIGDVDDKFVIQEFITLLKKRMGKYDEERIISEPANSVEQLLSQLLSTDIVVATRFHNVLLALLLNKPTVAIAFHHKCTSLMNNMGLAEYCHDINQMDGNRLIEQFQDVERNAVKLKTVIRQRVEQARQALDEQYNLIFKSL